MQTQVIIIILIIVAPIAATMIIPFTVKAVRKCILLAKEFNQDLRDINAMLEYERQYLKDTAYMEEQYEQTKKNLEEIKKGYEQLKKQSNEEKATKND